MVMVYFIFSCLFLMGLIFVDRYIKGPLQVILRIAIHVISVALFFSFLWYLMTFLLRPFEMSNTLAVGIFLFVLLGSGLFYYIARKNI